MAVWWRVPGREGVVQMEVVEDPRSRAGCGPGSKLVGVGAWGGGEHGFWGGRRAAESWGQEVWIAKTGGVGKGGQQMTCLPRGVQRRRCQEKCVRERGSGLAFMLLCECPRAWREPLRMAALCSEQLLRATAWPVMRWGVFAFHSSPFSLPFVVDLIL